jgi:hypothetical protein
VHLQVDGCNMLSEVVALMLNQLIVDCRAGTLANAPPMMMVVSRVALVNLQAFAKACDLVSAKTGRDAKADFFDVLLDKFETARDPGMGKPIILALAYVFSLFLSLTCPLAVVCFATWFLSVG